MPDFRGGPPDWSAQLGQLGQLGQQAAAVPSLLQMAQGIAPEAGRGGGIGNGAGDFPGTSWGNAQQNIGAPPAWAEAGGSNPQSFPTAFSQRAPTDGGWFTLNDYYKQRPAGYMQGVVPDQFQSGSSLPSTLNWRLLPPDWRKPGNFMINGQIIDRGKIGSDVAPPPPNPEGTGPAPLFPAHGAGFPYYWQSSPTYGANLGFLGQITPKASVYGTIS